MTLHRKRQSLQRPLGSKIIENNPLLHLNWLAGDTIRLRIETKVKNQLLRSPGNAAEVGVAANRILIGHFNSNPLLLRISLS